MISQSTINKVILLGHITQEPRWHSDMGEKVLYFTLLTTEKVRKNANYLHHEEYHNIRITGDMMDDTQLRKGQLVYVQGKIQTRQFTDVDKVRRYKTEIAAISVDVVSPATAELDLSQEHRF